MTSTDEIIQKIEHTLAGIDARLGEIGVMHVCTRCSRREGNDLVGPLGEDCRLAGGYETVLCRRCKNAWTTALDESGHWQEYRLATECLALAKSSITAMMQSGQARPTSEADLMEGVSRYVERQLAAERKMFQLAMKWIADREKVVAGDAAAK